MMNTEQWFDMALLGSVAVSWLAVVLSLFCIRRQRQQAELTRKLYERLDHDLQLTNSGSIGMGKRLVAMEKVLHQHAKQKTQQTQATAIEPTPAPAARLASAPAIETPSHAAYNDAARLFDAGVESEEVARRCGLSRAEASLMQLMHKQVNQEVTAA